MEGDTTHEIYGLWRKVQTLRKDPKVEAKFKEFLPFDHEKAETAFREIIFPPSYSSSKSLSRVFEGQDADCNQPTEAFLAGESAHDLNSLKMGLSNQLVILKELKRGTLTGETYVRIAERLRRFVHWQPLDLKVPAHWVVEDKTYDSTTDIAEKIKEVVKVAVTRYDSELDLFELLTNLQHFLHEFSSEKAVFRSLEEKGTNLAVLGAAVHLTSNALRTSGRARDRQSLGNISRVKYLKDNSLGHVVWTSRKAKIYRMDEIKHGAGF